MKYDNRWRVNDRDFDTISRRVADKAERLLGDDSRRDDRQQGHGKERDHHANGHGNGYRGGDGNGHSSRHPPPKAKFIKL